MTNRVFGHVVVFDERDIIHRFADTLEPVPYNARCGRLCPKCQKPETPEGHDPCIFNLPGVEFACCGHGLELGYVKFTDGRVIRGYFDE